MALAKKVMTNKITKDDVYVDTTKANAQVNAMEKALNSLVKTTDQLGDTIKAMIKNNAVSGSLKEEVYRKLPGKLNKASTGLNKRKSTLRSKYNADVQDITILGLMNQIAALTERLKKVEDAINKTDTVAQ